MKKKIILAVIALVCMVILCMQISLADLKDTLKNISPAFFAMGFGLAMASYLLKALRYHVILSPPGSRSFGGRAFPRIFGITATQQIVAQMLPLRAGDVSFVALIKKSGLASMGVALAALLICRFLDLVILFLMFACSLMFLELQNPLFHDLAVVIGCLLLGGIILMGMLIVWAGRGVRMIQGMLERFGLLNWSPVKRLWDGFTGGMAHLESLRSARLLVKVSAVSVVIWAASTAWNYAVWRAVGISLSLPEILFLTSFSYLFTLVPVFIFGGIGTGDLINTKVLNAFGYASSAAASAAIFSRVLTILYQLLLVVLAYRFIQKPTEPELKKLHREGREEREGGQNS